jgi:hypothetical protein
MTSTEFKNNKMNLLTDSSAIDYEPRSPAMIAQIAEKFF